MATNLPSSPMMRALAAGVMGNVPVLIEDEPGRGKTAKIVSMSERTGYHVEVLVGSIREPQDYLGLPIEVDGQVVYSPPAWARRLSGAEKGMLVLDEFNTSNESVMKANLRLLQERYAGDEKLSDGTRIIAISNPVESSTGGLELPPAIANRMMHLTWHFDRDEWLANIATRFENTDVFPFEELATGGTDSDRARAVALITGFLTDRPDLHAPSVPSDPYEAGKAWPSPRSWSNVIDVISHLDPNDDAAIMLVVRGLVGDGAAKDFYAWREVRDLVDPAALLDNPNLVDWSAERPDRLFVTLSAVEALVSLRGDAKAWEKGLNVLLTCAEKGKPDVALVPARSMLNPANRPEGSKMDVNRVHSTFGDVMAQMSNGFAA